MTNFSLVKESDKEDYYNKAAAHRRQEKLEKDVAAYLERGGEVTEVYGFEQAKPVAKPSEGGLL